MSPIIRGSLHPHSQLLPYKFEHHSWFNDFHVPICEVVLQPHYTDGMNAQTISLAPVLTHSHSSAKWLTKRRCPCLSTTLLPCMVLKLVFCCLLPKRFWKPPEARRRSHALLISNTAAIIAALWKIRAGAWCKLLILLFFAHKKALLMPDCCASCIMHCAP